MTITVAKDAGSALTRHVTLLRAKTVERDGERFIEGWATRPEEDRMGDVVVPEGARFTLPLPLLFAHKHDEPIGSVIEANVTKAGIRIRARLTAGVARAEEVWKLIKDGALSAVSIGFQAIKSTPLPSGGLRFDEWDWYELSVVAAPALPSARISVAKCIAYRDERHVAPKERLPAYVPCGDVVEVATVSPQSTKQADKPKAAPMSTQKYITEKQMERFSEQLGTSLGGLIADTIRPLVERIEALEKQRDELLSEIERRTWKYKGYWEADKSYRLNDVVTEQGSTWLALCDTKERPNFSSNSWRVIAKKGRDAS